MAVDALTPAELASLGIGSVPGTGPAFGVGMTPNELKEALDRRGIGYDRALLGSMQQEYASMFGPGAKTAKKDKTDEEDIIYGGTPPNVTPPGAPPAKDYWGYSAPTTTTKNTVTDQLVNGFPPTVDLFANPTIAGMKGKAAPAAPPSLPSLPGLPAAPATGGYSTGGYSDEDIKGFETLDPEYGAKSPSEALAGGRGSGMSEFATLDPEFGAKSPSEALAGNRGMDTGQPPGANPAAGHDMLATGDTGGGAPGGRVNFGGWDKGRDSNGAGGSGAGQGAGSGPSGGDPGSSAGGVGGVGEGGMGTGAGQGEGGNGGWRMGTADTGNDGDMMMDEEVEPPVHEDEAVLPKPMRNDIGEDILAEAIALYQDQGLTPRERKIMLKDLLGEWAASK